MAHVRSNVEHVSQLPVYEAKRSLDFPSWLIVTCPREDCREQFLVQSTRWIKPRRYTSLRGESHTIKGRSCPYCMRVGRVPTRAKIG
jgi:hypothetical protein